MAFLMCCLHARSDFGKVFDVENFVKTLENDVKVVHALPDHLREGSIYEVAPRSWSEVTNQCPKHLPSFLPCFLPLGISQSLFKWWMDPPPH